MPNFLISGGGTGGHIYPAIAIANALRRAFPTCGIHFVGAEGKMEMQKVPEAGFEITALPVAGLQRRFTYKNFLLPFKLWRSYAKAKSLLKIHNPDVCIGVGGYASAPLLFAAQMEGIPTLIQEQNSYAGLTNKFLAKRAKSICVAYKDMEAYFPSDKLVFTGNPVRSDIANMAGKRAEAFEFFNLQADLPVVLVIGGSLGARTINESIKKVLNDGALFASHPYQLIWQTGKHGIDMAQLAINGCAFAQASAFISRMDLAYAAADVVVSRAGALSISEIALCKKPAILIPSPNVTADHQTKNALALVKEGAALIIKDSEALSSLEKVLSDLLSNGDLRDSLSAKVGALASPNAADLIVEQVDKLLKK